MTLYYIGARSDSRQAAIKMFDVKPGPSKTVPVGYEPHDIGALH